MTKKTKKKALLLLVGLLIIGIPLIIGSIFAAPQNLITNLDMIQVSKGNKPDGVSDHVLQKNQSYNQLVNDYYLRIKWEQMASDIKANFPYIVRAEGSLVLGEKTEKIVVVDSKDPTKTYEIGEIKSQRDPVDDESKSTIGSVTLTFNNSVTSPEVKNMLLKGTIYVGLTTDLNNKLLESNTPTVSVMLEDKSSTINPVKNTFVLKHGNIAPSIRFEYKKSSEGSYASYFPIVSANDVILARDVYTPASGYDFYFKDITFTFNDYAMDLFSDANGIVPPQFNGKPYEIPADIFTRTSTNERRPSEWATLGTYKSQKTTASSNWLLRIDPIVVRSENSKPIVFTYSMYMNPLYMDTDFIDSRVKIKLASNFEIKYVNTYLNEIISTAEGSSVAPDTTSVTINFAAPVGVTLPGAAPSPIVYKDIPLTSDQFKNYTLNKAELTQLEKAKYVAVDIKGIDTLSKDPALNVVSVSVLPYSAYPVNVTINYFYTDVTNNRPITVIKPIVETAMLDSTAYKDYKIPADATKELDNLGLVIKNKTSLPVLSQDPNQNIVNIEVGFKDIVVTFVVDDKGKIETQNVKKGDLIKKPTNPTKPDNKFIGWSTQKDGSVLWDFDKDRVDTSITLYPIFKEVNKFRISFVTPDNATKIDPIIVSEGSKATEPQKPIRPGHVFAEWCTDVNLTTKWDFNTVVTGDITLYSKWSDAQKLKVTFYPRNGGTATNVDVAYGTKLTRPLDPVYKGYELVGWFTDSSLTTEWDFENHLVTKQMSLNAKWQVAPKLTVRYEDGKGKLLASKTVSKGELLIKPTFTVPAGSGIDGWFTDEKFTNEWIFASDRITDNTTLYAKINSSSYTITFNTNGGSVIDPVSVPMNSLIQKPTDPVYTGYNFVGWFKDSTLKSPWDFANNKVTKSTILYAKWALASYEVTFNTNGGSVINPVTINANKLIQKPADPIKNGYVFEGWFKDSSYSSEWNFSTDVVTAATTLYAKWTEKTFVITFDVNGGTPAINNQKIGLNNKIKKPTDPKKTGLIFGGWFTDNSFTTEWNFNDAVTSELNLIAKWNANPNSMLVINFNSDGGSKVNTMNVKYGSLITEPSKPVKKGSVFAGWYSDNALTNKWDFNTPVTSNMTLFASWSTNNNSFTITLDTQGGSAIAPIPVVYGNTIPKPSDPTKAGYEFAGWFKDANGYTAWNFDKDVVTSDMTLYAVWKDDSTKFTVTFETGKGSSIAPQSVSSGGLVRMPSTPKLDDNCFSGWFADSELTVRWIFSKNRIYENTTLYAKYCYE